jgi:hypothetical protein
LTGNCLTVAISELIEQAPSNHAAAAITVKFLNIAILILRLEPQ